MWTVKTIMSSDPDEFVSVIRPPHSKITVSERGAFRATTTLIDVGQLYAQRGVETLARVLHLVPSRTGIIFLTYPGAPMFWNGAEVRYDQVALCGSDETYLMRLTGETSYSAMTLADAHLATVRASNLECAAAPVSGFLVITPPAELMARLRLLHASIADTVSLSRRDGREHALEQVLTAIFLEIISIRHLRSDTVARQHHHLIGRRFLEMLELQSVSPMDMQKISDTIGISSRTLRVACQEQFGVSPTQLLLLRRMSVARRALQQADPAITRVTDIATVLGFWELGRFAVRYREIFGESPSSTLKAAGFGGGRDLTESDYVLA